MKIYTSNVAAPSRGGMFALAANSSCLLPASSLPPRRTPVASSAARTHYFSSNPALRFTSPVSRARSLHLFPRRRPRPTKLATLRFIIRDYGPAHGDGDRGARGRKPRGASERGARIRRQSPTMLRLRPAAAAGRVVLACARDLHPAPRPPCGSAETAQKRALVCGDDWPRPLSASLSQQRAGRGRPDGEGGEKGAGLARRCL